MCAFQGPEGLRVVFGQFDYASKRPGLKFRRARGRGRDSSDLAGAGIWPGPEFGRGRGRDLAGAGI